MSQGRFFWRKRFDFRAIPHCETASATGYNQAPLNAILIVLVAVGLVALQLLIGGVKMVYSLPAYIALGVAGIASVGWWRRQPTAKPSAWCLASAIALSGYVVWRAVTAPIDYLARTDFYMIIGALLVYLLISVHVVNPRHRLALLWVLFSTLLIHVAVGVVQFKEKQNFMLLPWILRSDYGYRASGFYICPNHLAGLLEMLGLLSLSIATWGRGKTWTRLVAGYVALMALVGVALTGSRGGYISLVIGLATFGLLALFVVRRVKRRWFWGVLLLGALGLSGLVGTSVLMMRKSADLERRLGQVYEPTNMRRYMWTAALEAHKLSPWTGVGSGSYLFYGRHFRQKHVQADPQHVHNDYLELLTEYGIAGCIVMAIFLVLHAGSGFAAIGAIIRTRLRPFGLARSNELAVVIGVLSAFAALSVHSVIDFNFHIPANALLAAALFGILANPRTPTQEEQPRWRVGGLWLRLSPVFLGAIAIALAAPRVLPEYCAERARMALRDQKPELSIAYAERGIRHDARNPNLYFYLGESKHILAMQEKDPAKAFKLNAAAAIAFSEGIKYFPSDLQLLLKLGRTLDNLQRFDEAEYVFRVALQADPNLANVYAYYGYHNFLQRRLLRAEKLYRKAYELGDGEIAPVGLQDIAAYRFKAAEEDAADAYPIADEPDDELWEPGQP